MIRNYTCVFSTKKDLYTTVYTIYIVYRENIELINIYFKVFLTVLRCIIFQQWVVLRIYSLIANIKWIIKPFCLRAVYYVIKEFNKTETSITLKYFVHHSEPRWGSLILSNPPHDNSTPL